MDASFDALLNVSMGHLRLENKVSDLENTLKTFRAEVDMKMKIMEQILAIKEW